MIHKRDEMREAVAVGIGLLAQVVGRVSDVLDGLARSLEHRPDSAPAEPADPTEWNGTHPPVNP